jgi:radical SAM protein with 4Fe4S-binding SPASM domain
MIVDEDTGIYDWLLATSRDKQIPLYGMIELTGQCNLYCRHCFVTSEERKAPGLTTQQYIKLLEQMHKSGAFFVILSGGEIFLRTDLFTIIEKAKELRLSVRLFTNGTLITREVAHKITTLYPEAVEISLYGAKNNTHDWLTRVPGSFEKTVAAIESLTERGVLVVVKNVWMGFNWSEADDWLTLVEKLGGVPRWSANVVPENDGGLSPTELRLNDEQLMELYDWELAWKQKNDRFKNSYPEDTCNKINNDGNNLERVMGCGATINNYLIDFRGEVMPCPQIRLSAGNVLNAPFGHIWKNSRLFSQLRAMRDLPVSGCQGCTYWRHCNRCPGLAWIEDGGFTLPSSWACKIARIYSEVE